ncbi:MAG: hypothetical protein GY932_04400 [Arcobacter sp.]|nr:hypothetical protein [Arcobacter sp.]
MKNMKYLYLIIFVLFSSFIYSLYSGNNKATLEELKSSTAHVIKVNQKLLNTNKDGSVNDKKFTPEKFDRLAYNQFKKMATGEKWKIKDLANSNVRGIF